MELLTEILTEINNILLIVMGVAFGAQLIFIIFFFLPPKKYKKAEEKKRFGIVIPARNESSVIADTLRSIFAQNYPRELFDVFVVADNCTDNTAEVARNAGAIVFERFDDDPSHRRASYALQYCFSQILENYDNYDAFIRFDADNYVDCNYIDKMNDALCSGVKLARGYNNAKNLDENVIATISGLWYIRDCRFSCHVRQALGLSQIMVGSGMTISAEIIRKNGGWIHMGFCEDADFSIDERIKGTRAHYVKDAILYEDQPTTVTDTFRRNKRMGRGLIYTFGRYGTASLGKFFTRPHPSFLDLFLTELFIPITLVCCVWMPLYYGYVLSYYAVVGNMAEFFLIIDTAWKALLFAFAIPFIAQALFVCMLERKRIKTRFVKLLPGIILFPMFMIFYAAGIGLGIMTKAKWKSVTRSQNINYAALDGNTFSAPTTEVASTTENTDANEQNDRPTTENTDANEQNDRPTTENIDANEPKDQPTTENTNANEPKDRPTTE